MKIYELFYYSYGAGCILNQKITTELLGKFGDKAKVISF